MNEDKTMKWRLRGKWGGGGGGGGRGDKNKEMEQKWNMKQGVSNLKLDMIYNYYSIGQSLQPRSPPPPPPTHQRETPKFSHPQREGISKSNITIKKEDNGQCQQQIVTNTLTNKHSLLSHPTQGEAQGFSCSMLTDKHMILSKPTQGELGEHTLSAARGHLASRNLLAASIMIYLYYDIFITIIKCNFLTFSFSLIAWSSS